MKPSLDNRKKPYNCRTWYSWGTSATWTAAEWVIWLNTHQPGDLCCVLMTVSWCRCFMSWVERVFCWTCWCSKKERISWICKIYSSLCQQRLWTEVSTTMEFARADSGLLKDLLERISWETALDGRDLPNLHGLPPQTTGTMHRKHGRPVRMNKEFLIELKFLNELLTKEKWARTTEPSHECQRSAGLKNEKDVKVNRIGFCKCLSCKR